MDRIQRLKVGLKALSDAISRVRSQRFSLSNNQSHDRDKLKAALKKSRQKLTALSQDLDRQKTLSLQRRQQAESLRSQRRTYRKEHELLLELLSSSASSLLTEQKSLNILVDYARFSTSSIRFSSLKNNLQNACSSIIDNSNEQRVVDSAKLLLGVINYYSGLEKGSLSYFQAIADKSLLPEFAFVEYYRTAFKYSNIHKSNLSPAELLHTVDDVYLNNEENVFALVAGINSCSDMPIVDRVSSSQMILAKYSAAHKISNKSLLWAKNYLDQSMLSMKQSCELNQTNEDVINVGIMDYKMVDLDFTSGNLGDYVQTIASALAWNQALGVKFSEDSDVGKAINTTLDSAKITSCLTQRRLNPVVINRDSSFYNNNYPLNTWFVCNGWYHHSAFKTDLEFGYPENINPIFVSFHLNKSSQLRPEMIRYLKSNQPIGCRDWTTVYMLKSQGIQAFFSGCLTMTIGDLYHDSDQPLHKSKIACVEAEADPTDDQSKVVDYVQVGDDVKEISISEGIRDAYHMLKRYLDYDKIYTSRLHCYLPCTSMGLKVSFKPKNYSDQRYPGLSPLTSDEFLDVRGKLRNNLNSAISFIEKSSPTKQEFLNYWASLWHEELQAAEVRYQDGKNISLKDVSIDVDESLSFLRKNCISSPQDVGPNSIHIAFGFDSNLLEQFEVTTQSLLSNTPSSMCFYVLGRGLPNEWIDKIISKYPQIKFNFYDMSIIDYGDNIRTLSHITESTMDRVFLSELLPIEKIIYLDTDLIVRSNIAELWNIDIGNNLMAGVQSILYTWKDIFSIVLRASRRLDAESAENLRRYCYSKFPDSVGSNFNAGVLVMNLRLMRSVSFVQDALPFIIHYGLNDQDVLSLIANNNVFRLGREFNVVPTQSYMSNPKIVHWAGPRKPWKKDVCTPFKNEYLHYKKLTS